MKNLPRVLLSLFFVLYLFYLPAADEKMEKILKNFDTYAEAQRRVWNVQGMAIAIIKEDQILLAKGYGQRGLTDTRPVDENTLFQIGSLSKAFTSALVALSVDKGQLTWEDKVIEHMPSFHLNDPWASSEFQVVDLLAQRSGLPPHAGEMQSFLGYSQEEMLKHLRFLKPQTSFRSTFAYQNIPFLVAAHIIEKKNSLTYPHLLRKELFAPLEMTNSSATLEEYLANDNRAQWLVHLKDGSIFHLKDDFPEANWNYLLGPAGGIDSSVKDMANWMILQANQGQFKGKQIISKTTMQRMARPMIYMGEIAQEEAYYALGWVHLSYSPFPIIFHNGATLGVYNFAAFIPQEKVGIVILTNGGNTNLATALTLQFFDIYFEKPNQDWSQKLLAKDKEQSKPSQKKPENPYPSQPLSTYAGQYRNPIYGEVSVKQEGKGLVLVMGKKQQQLTLKPWDRDIFTLSWPTLNLDEGEPIKVLFMPDSTGKITKMEIDTFSKEGDGDFEKVSHEPVSVLNP